MHNDARAGMDCIGSKDVPLKTSITNTQGFPACLGINLALTCLGLFPCADWPVVLCHGVLLLDTSADVDDPDEWIDLDDFGPLPDDILELDDQHAAFLEEDPHQAEADEVERLVTRIELVTEQRSAAF